MFMIFGKHSSKEGHEILSGLNKEGENLSRINSVELLEYFIENDKLNNQGIPKKMYRENEIVKHIDAKNLNVKLTIMLDTKTKEGFIKNHTRDGNKTIIYGVQDVTVDEIMNLNITDQWVEDNKKHEIHYLQDYIKITDRKGSVSYVTNNSL